MTSRFALAKAKILDNLEDLVRELFGANASARHKRNSLWNVANPWRANSHPDQMVIWLTGNRRGAWKDFVSEDKGDGVDLVAFALEGFVSPDTRMRAVQWIEDKYGLRAMDPKTRQTMEAEAEARRKVMDAQAIEDRRDSAERVRKFFYGSGETLMGTPVETYLASRNIRLGEVPNLTHSFRYRENCDYWMAPQKPAPQFPALISAMVSGTGALGACHLTFLEPWGARKLDTIGRGWIKSEGKGESAKLFKGDTAGLLVRVTNGPSGLAAEAAGAQGALGLIGITEGIEDALSVAIAHPSLRMWAAGSLSALLTVPDHAAASGYLVFKDNDWGKPQATKLFNRAMARFRGFGKPVEEISMPADWGKDVNDALNQ